MLNITLGERLSNAFWWVVTSSYWETLKLLYEPVGQKRMLRAWWEPVYVLLGEVTRV